MDITIKLSSDEEKYCREVWKQRHKIKRRNYTMSTDIFMRVVDEVMRNG